MEQWRFAEKVGCSKETIRKIEKGQIKLSDELALKISLATGVDRSWLLANDLSVPPTSRFGRYQYSREDFSRAQMESNANIPQLLPAAWLLKFHARLAAISSKAWAAGLHDHQLAMYKISEILKGLEEKIGVDEDVYPTDNRSVSKAVEIAKRGVQEVETALGTGELYEPHAGSLIILDMVAKAKFESQMAALSEGREQARRAHEEKSP